MFDIKRRRVVLSNSGLPYPIRCSGEEIAQIVLPGFPLGTFAGSTYDEVSFDLAPSDVFVFCSDGIFDAQDALGRRFDADRLLRVVTESRHKSAGELIDAIFAAVQEFRGETPSADDMTAVAVKITT